MERKTTISIHAPAKGATVRKSYMECIKQFQSTLPRRERRTSRKNAGGGKNFNPRSREGSDEAYNKKVTEANNFNPRSREGSDKCKIDQVGCSWISIHAPAKGATISNLIAISISNFNPRSREGSDSKQFIPFSL